MSRQPARPPFRPSSRSMQPVSRSPMPDARAMHRPERSQVEAAAREARRQMVADGVRWVVTQLHSVVMSAWRQARTAWRQRRHARSRPRLEWL